MTRRGHAVVLQSDAAHLPLPDASVDLICTSPPYFGQRAYTDGGASYPGQIGAEATPAEYVAALLECTREWIRVLRPTGSIFVNLGDKYSGYSGAHWGKGRSLNGRRGAARVPLTGPRSAPGLYGVPNKSLMGMPWRYALGCIDDLGLILRAEIIWSKPSPMPESVTDRVRRAHEQVFHFTRQRRYFSGTDEIRQPRARTGPGPGPNPPGTVPRSVWEIAATPLRVPDHLNVEHHAAFPLGLPRRIIAGWSPTGICTRCGEGMRPVPAASGGLLAAGTSYACACTPYTDHPERRGTDFHAGTDRRVRGMNDGNGGDRYRRYMNDQASPRLPVREYHTANWARPPSRPATVLDPFGGTGTTALAAVALGRTGISVDRSADYCRIARWRTGDPRELARAAGSPKLPASAPREPPAAA